MKKNTLPSNRLDIITPVLSYIHLNRDAEPELRKIILGESGEAIQLSLITKQASLVARKATEIIAYYFRREFGYDFPPYEAQQHADAKDRVFLLTQEIDGDTSYAVGVIAFQWRNYTDAPEQLVLAWVWVHPFLRRQGILTAYWDTFRKLYGNFYVEPPLSKAMKSFLENHA